MHYYEVFVAEVGYTKPSPLTYSFPDILVTGAIVLVPFGRKNIAGFVSQKVHKPTFDTKQIIQALTEPPLPLMLRKLHTWLGEYYPSGSGALTQLFVPSGLDVKNRGITEKQPTPTDLPPITEQQKKILHKIDSSTKRTFLLHGATGSGKTRIYLERAGIEMKNGSSVLILTPEISLVPQLAKVFAEQFGDKVVTMHSGLTKSTRNRHWSQILKATEPLIIIGTRSALFSPIKKLGLIVIDEMHEPAYKQEQAPRYQALRVAGALAKLHGADTIYGSATPPIIEHYIAEATGIPILHMTKTALTSQKVTRTIVDMKDKNLFSRHPSISDPLLTALEKNLQNHQQSMLFLNRRGTARLILCHICGWQAMCPRCDIPLTYHGDNHTMRCHTCGYRGRPPYACPDCGSDNITYRSIGTKALVDTLHKLLPEAVVKRFDTDNYAAEKLAHHFESIQKGDVDILVGTQMIGKGLDLPKLSLVGIINADTGLNMPDFSAAERSYQLLHQAIGRVGRGHTLGEVIVQTYNPLNPLLLAAVTQNWQLLYEQELAERRRFGFPPFRFMLKIDVNRKSAKAAEEFVSKLHQHIIQMRLPIELSEPAPAFYERSHGSYHWQLVIKSKIRSRLVQVMSSLPAGNYNYDIDPINLL
ncbi:MAG: primosomal protein N' [bacterium]|nr:primosomal protein N' [bacterium]